VTVESVQGPTTIETGDGADTLDVAISDSDDEEARSTIAALLTLRGVEPQGQAEWRIGRDDVFADLGRGGGEVLSPALLESTEETLLAGATVKSGEEPAQARVPRRSRMQRFEREFDACFAELAAEDGGDE
jgi:hypothetical protein